MPHVPHVRSTAQWHVPFPSAPVVEHHRAPLGIGEPEPRLSWTTAAEAGWVQRAYEVEVGGEPTGWVESDGSVLVPWPAEPLGSRDRRELRVRVRGDGGTPSPWSAPSFVEAGLLRPSDWVARMVSPVAGRRPPLLRREFAVRAPIARARLYTTAQGVHEVLLNGSRVGDEVLAPGWTSYRRRLRYRTHDVTGLLRHGRNALGVALADGWYRGRLGFSGRRAVYGDRLAALVQLEVVGEDGSRQVVGTDERWRAGTGGLVSAGLYDGEHFDARRHPSGWAEPGFDDSGWGAVEVVERDLATLVAPTGPPVRRTELLRPVAVTALGRGRHLLDFGQNLVGRLRLRVDEGAAREVVVRHAEVLEDGELCTRPLRGARATDRYAPGAGTAVWEPSFTYHGFRYAEVTGLPGAPDVVAAVCGTDLRRTGWFRCSDPDLERLHENEVWIARGWVGRVERALDEDGVWRRGFQFGDWLDPAAPPDRPHEARTAPAVVATAYAARSARVLARVADLVGAPGDAVRLRALARRVAAGFARAFPDQGGTQTGLALALRFGLVPARERARVARRLAGLVRAEGHRVGTGFAGTPVVLDALADNGYLDDAYLLLTQRECPSWLYAVERGATTVWERWDALLPDGRVNPAEMTSFNHFALGSVADWMHRAVAGLAPGAPGYRVIRVAPRFGGGLVSAEAEHLTPYGRARVAWRRSGERAVVDVVAPTGTRAVLDLPGAAPQEVGPGRHRFTVPCRAVRADVVHVW
ncbi:family 78 glycoside hydrolase catalytic domain [Actinosynnema sp.]|uniref:family 78 glycoside hydrolase catalytic domain n=1 Tax=Actinosynnema sp. TaxID=1872144 RepID=UPI003F83430D